jgi:transcription termination factor Rho
VSALSSLDDESLASLASRAGVAPLGPGERRSDFLYRLLQAPGGARPTASFAEGLLETMPEGYGFLRRPETSYAPTPEDVFVPPAILGSLGLLPGHWVSGTAVPPRRGERYPVLVEVEEVNHEDPSRLRDRVPFEELTATFPDQRLLLETTPDEVSMRIMDLFCPLGRGQRALIVSPPRAGKTIILQKLADSIARNSPSTEVVVLLVDERPEEVTNMRRSVRGEVLASTFDQPAHRHIRLAELAMEKVKRLVEYGRHVVLLIDSMTRLGRAYNNEAPATGRLLTGGMDAKALTKPKRFFSSARNVEGGGSLTIVATALVDTGSRLDQVVFEEFKGTGNMELVLSRDLSNQRLWPAIDIPKSGTRNEELLLHPEEQRRVVALRRAMADEAPAEVLEDMLEKMAKHKTNAEFLMNVDV